MNRFPAVYVGDKPAEMVIAEIDLPEHGQIDHDDPIEDNTTRAGSAAVALKAYARTGGGSYLTGEAPETAIYDLLGDLRHLCDALGLNFDELNDRGARHYEAEVTGEDYAVDDEDGEVGGVGRGGNTEPDYRS